MAYGILRKVRNDVRSAIDYRYNGKIVQRLIPHV